jgi:arylformamidase
MKYYDISMPIEEAMPVPGNHQELKPKRSAFHLQTTSDIPRSRLEIDLRTGTHLLAPMLTRPDGDSVDLMSPSCIITACRVLDLTTTDEWVDEEDLALFGIQPGEFILIKTQNSLSDSAVTSEVQLTLGAALYMARIGVKGVGIDALALKQDNEHAILEALFERGCALLLGLRMKHVHFGGYRLIALPLRIVGAEASPVRAVLIEG